jgi:hypothetical protein
MAVDPKWKESWEALQKAAFVFGPTQDWDEFISTYPWVWGLWNEAYYKERV